MPMFRPWVCQIRPGKPKDGQRLQPEDFFRPEKVQHIIFEKGINVAMYDPKLDTIIIAEEGFCVVKKPFIPRTITRGFRTGREITFTLRDPNVFCVCPPHSVGDREVVFVSPSIRDRFDFIKEIGRQEDGRST